MRYPFAAALLAFGLASTSSYGAPITLSFSGEILSSYSNPSWSGQSLSGQFTIYPENFSSQYSSFTPTSTQVYTFLGPAYGISGAPIIDYTINLPDGSVYKAPHEGAFAEWGSITVHHQYLDGPGEETYQIGLQIQPLNQPYQIDFFFILDNELRDGALVSSASLNQVPNIQAATRQNAYLSVFDYRSVTSKLDVSFSVDSLTAVPEPSTWLLMVAGVAGVLFFGKRAKPAGLSIASLRLAP